MLGAMTTDMDWRTWMNGENRTVEIQRNYGEHRSVYPHRAEARVDVADQTLCHQEVGADPDHAADAAVAGLRKKIREALDET